MPSRRTSSPSSTIRGSRGLLFVFGDGGKNVQRFWLFPHGFQGRITDPVSAAWLGGKSDRFMLYRPRHDAWGWFATSEVIAALGLKEVKLR